MTGHQRSQFGVTQCVHWLFVASTVAVLAAAISEYHGRLITNQEIAAQYHQLRNSELCTTPEQRLSSVDVNGCAAAEHAANSFQPHTVALLETLQALSMCGVHGERCARLAHSLAEMGLSFIAVAAALFMAVAWLLVQKYKIDKVVANSVPLDTTGYPTHTPFYCSKPY